ncbi:MAG: Crp/Fnr family transcriptional regulator [Thermosynechococcaceae cyanobacterium]
MYHKLIQRLNQIIPLTTAQQQKLCQVVQVEERPKNWILLEQDTIANHIYFLVEGIVRSYCIVDGKEITQWFGVADHFCVAHISFATRNPSQETLILVTDCKLLSISYQNLQALFQEDTIWIDLNRRLLTHYHNALLQRVLSFQTQSTLERYENFLTDHPTLEDKIALGHLASYLGMTPETLSRLRARHRKRKTRSTSAN